MSWQDCFELGQQLFEMEDYNNTKVWIRESMERLRRHSSPAHSPPTNGPDYDTLNKMETVAKGLFQLGEHWTSATASGTLFDSNSIIFFRRLRHGLRAQPTGSPVRSETHPELALGRQRCGTSGGVRWTIIAQALRFLQCEFNKPQNFKIN